MKGMGEKRGGQQGIERERHERGESIASCETKVCMTPRTKPQI